MLSIFPVEERNPSFTIEENIYVCVSVCTYYLLTGLGPSWFTIYCFHN